MTFSLHTRSKQGREALLRSPVTSYRITFMLTEDVGIVLTFLNGWEKMKNLHEGNLGSITARITLKGRRGTKSGWKAGAVFSCQGKFY